MSYNYSDIIDIDPHSYQEKFLEYANNWEDDSNKEKKRVKIIFSPSKDENVSFEDKINSFIETEANKINIIDIKYQKNSVLIIYEEKKNL